VMLSADGYHPSAAGYALAANQLLPALCHALGEWTGTEPPELPWKSGSTGNPLVSHVRSLTRLLRGRSTGVPAPIVVTAG